MGQAMLICSMICQDSSAMPISRKPRSSHSSRMTRQGWVQAEGTSSAASWPQLLHRDVGARGHIGSGVLDLERIAHGRAQVIAQG